MSENVTGVRVPPPVFYLAGFLAGYLLQRWRPLPWPHGMANDVIGAGLVIVGAGLVLDFVQRFHHFGTTTSPRGAATNLVVEGAYRFTRNPGYLGWALASAGVAMLVYWTWCLALLPVVILLVDRLVIAHEERFLEERFGNEYRAYKHRVRRWI
jgi:protein-S-isoprenylcysteine O-methyltransferase Ste14